MRLRRSPLSTAVPAALLALGLAAAAPAHAEKADREKPVNIEADKMFYDDLRQVNIFEGHVVLTQGTLVIRADKLTVTQDPEGFQTGIADKGAAGLAYFRQKRDGVEEYIEGWGERIKYDAKTDKADLITRARILRNGDEARGNVINYDGRTEFYTVDGQGRPVNVTIMPKSAGATAGDKNSGPAGKGSDAAKGGPSKGSGPDLSLKSSGGIAAPREEYPEPPKK
ncbi:MAG TPA: lipopolysaccharide transport periplasmic protein LptA [Burkholderiales bacterium]|jgi:lipopolysaccharide export system protein LptA|nr:lipopolysaccharide transport periplasmic protein LptA [Burkholderiales bacterium]